MAYIDLDKINRLRPKLTAKYPLSFANGISVAINEINRLPNADVVPKSEVEMLQGALKAEERHNELTMEMAQKALKNAKADVAREIFEEIEKVRMQHTFGDIDGSELNVRLYQLKKKYTEGN